MTTDRTVATRCPMCAAILPLFTVRLHVTGYLRPKVGMEVIGDATDYVAHLWTHNKEEQCL